MKLDLVNNKNSDIEYTVSKFPDGQQSIILETFVKIYPEQVIKIVSRLNSFLDLELIICANQTLLELGFEKIELQIPYFLGARSDRKFSEGSINYLKNVICPIINSQKFQAVTVLDPHSDVLEMGLNNFHKVNNFNLVKFALEKIDNKNDARERICLVSPDGGALKKIYDVAEHFQIDKIITAMKHRDIKTGKITHTEVPTLDQHNDISYVIVDDICDGGRTFIELAKAIKNSRPTAKVYLVVTHGIFSSGVSALSDYFEAIFCTNSYKDILKESEDTDKEIEAKSKVSQYNIF
jgi:ribose-phosphate pyrophosphokinase